MELPQVDLEGRQDSRRDVRRQVARPLHEFEQGRAIERGRGMKQIALAVVVGFAATVVFAQSPSPSLPHGNSMRMSQNSRFKNAFSFTRSSQLSTSAAFDSSGNRQLNGAYYFRQVFYFVADDNGEIGEATTVQGTITFDGNGNYSCTGTFLDSSTGSATPVAVTNETGTYVISASGEGYISGVNPKFRSDQIIGLVSHGIFIGSSTENVNGYNDLFIAAPIGSRATDATLNGIYSVAYFDPTFPGDALLNMTANGLGNIGTVNVTGYTGTSTSASTQSLTGVTYSFVNGAAQLNFGGSTSNLVGGTDSLYISPDGNFIFGGNAQGFDMFVGVRAATANPTNYSGLYYQAGLDLFEDTSESVLDSYFGSFQSASTQACGTPPVCFIGHQRVNSPLGYGGPTDFTYYDSYTLNGDGSSDDTTLGQHFVSSSGGSIRIGYGFGPALGINVALQAPSLNGSGVYLSPMGVVNAASSSPFTAFLSPGEFLTLYGSGLAPATNGASIPFPKILNGVQVLINQNPAPIYFVSPNQISVIVPYSVPSGSIAQIQVINNGTNSNVVTQFTGMTSAGIFTNNPVGGIGYAAALRPDYSIVSESTPAQVGETIAVYLAGMGPVSNQPADGAAAPSGPLSQTTNKPQVYIADSSGNELQATVTFSGLAPGFAGLYQINFTVPSGLASGDGIIEVLGPDSDTFEALLPIGAGSSSTGSSPSSIQIVSGNSQTASVGQAFPAPLLVKVTNSQGSAVSGVTVNWSVSEGNATLSNSSTSTGASGQSSTNVTAGNTAGMVTVTASVGSLTTQFSLEVTGGGTVSTSVYNSGQNASNGRDNSYEIISDTTGQIAAPAPAFVVTSLPGGWGTIPGAAWIGPSADQSNATRNGCCNNTSDTYQTTFSVSGDPSTFALNLTVAADDYVDVQLNGNTVFTHRNTAMWTTPVTFSINSGFVSGTNTLDFVVTNGGGPTGLDVAISSATSGVTQVTPGQTLTLTGSFSTDTTVTTSVMFTDNANYQLTVTPLSVSGSSVSVLVPPYFSTLESFTSGMVAASIAQQPTSGSGTTTAPVQLQIAALPQTGVPAGTLTLIVFTQLAQAIGLANQTWTTIQHESGGLVNASQLDLPTLQSNLNTMQSQIQALMSGSISQACLGQVNARDICLTTSSLALLDQVFYALYLGSTATPAQVAASQTRSATASPKDLVSSFQNWYTNLTVSTIPQTIRANASTLRTAVDIMCGIGTIAAAAAGASIAAPVVLAVALNLAITALSASSSAALEGGGSEILNGNTSDYKNTIGIIVDGVKAGLAKFTTLEGILSKAAGSKFGEAAGAVVDVVTGVNSLLDPSNQQGVTAQVEQAAGQGLFGSGTLNGTWTGSYSEAVCGSSGGPVTLTIQTSTSGMFTGSISYQSGLYDDPVDCKFITTLDNTGTISGTITGVNLTGSFSVSASYNGVPFNESSTVTATVTGNTMSGTWNDFTPSTTFTLTRQ
jgi:uncharacterized protein (TIGR03437 family)